MKSLAACGFLISAAVMAISCAAPRQQPAQSEANQLEAALIGEWMIAVAPTADVLARGQFGTRQEFTIKRGAAHPETNIVTKPFDQKAYEQSRDFWSKELGKPQMQWRFILKPDHTGEQHAFAEDNDTPRPRSIEIKPGWEQSIKYKPTVELIEWKLTGSELRFVYPTNQRSMALIAHVVSTNEWHYPMQPLGGCFVMRPAKADARR